jgi:hypothetical protein
LRDKLGADLIQTVHGIGYALRDLRAGRPRGGASPRRDNGARDAQRAPASVAWSDLGRGPERKPWGSRAKRRDLHRRSPMCGGRLHQLGVRGVGVYPPGKLGVYPPGKLKPMH